METFSSLQKNTNVVLEDPLLTKLYADLVRQGNFENCENIIMDALQGTEGVIMRIAIRNALTKLYCLVEHRSNMRYMYVLYASDDLFKSYVERQTLKPTWTVLTPPSESNYFNFNIFVHRAVLKIIHLGYNLRIHYVHNTLS